MEKNYICLFKVKFNNLIDGFEEEYGIISAKNYSDAMKKIEELFDGTLMQVTLILNDFLNREEIYIQKEVYEQLTKDTGLTSDEI